MSSPILYVSPTLELIGRLDGDSFSDSVRDSKGNHCSLFTTRYRGFISISNPKCGAINGSDAVYKLTLRYRNRHVKLRVAGTYSDLCVWLKAAVRSDAYCVLITSPDLAKMAGNAMWYHVKQHDWFPIPFDWKPIELLNSDASLRQLGYKSEDE